MRLLVSLLVWVLRAVFTSCRALALENLALRQFVVMHVASRRIVLINATISPGLAWVKQQIRQATEWAQCPRFLLHDNDGVYGQYQRRRARGERERGYRCQLDLWLAEVMSIEGIPIPYGAPNASPNIKRFNRTLREEALNHFIFLDAKHLRRVCREYVEFYNRARPSQALHAIPEPYPELITPPRRSGELIALPVLGGAQHDYRLAARRARPSWTWLARLLGGQVRATCGSVLIRSNQNATGAIGSALAGEATLARLPVSGAASGSRGLRIAALADARVLVTFDR